MGLISRGILSRYVLNLDTDFHDRMTFLYPSLLFGLLATAIPVLVHLFNFRRTKRVYFTNVAFLKQVNTTTSSFRRLKHLLIMAARMLFVAALVLAFAQPYLPAANRNGLGGVGIISFYVDNSLSMQNEVDNKRYLDLAATKLDELLGVFRNATNLQLVTNDFGSREHELNTSGQLKERLATVELSHTARSLDNVYRRQQSLLNKHNPKGGNQLFWFSDFQKSTVGDLSRLRTDTSSKLYLVPLQTKNTQNVYVDSVWLNTPFIREMQSNSLSVRLRNAGDAPTEGLNVKLFIDDTQVASQNLSLSARNAGVTTFSFTVKEKGFKKGRITFDDSPITFDNDYYFVLNAAPTIEVLHLFGQVAANRYVPNVFANDSIFSLKSYAATNFDIGQLQSANFVVLEGVPQVEGTVKTELEAFVRRGGSLLVIPPAKPNGPSYDAFLANLGIRGVVINGKDISPQDLQPLGEPDQRSPFFIDIFENSTIKEMVAMPNASAVWNWQAVGDKLLTFRSTQPFLTASTAQQGKVYMMAAPLDAQFGEFARNALFVPIMYKMAALSMKQEPAAYSFKANTFTLEVQNVTKNAVFKLKKDKIEVIPVQRLNGTQLTIELPKANQLNDNQAIESGYYELQLNGKTQKMLAFNHDNQESQMDFYSPEELRTIFAGQKNVEVFDRLTDEGFVQTFGEKNIGVSLWKYFLLAALFFLLVEIALVRLMKG